MDKVKLPKEVAEALASLIESRFGGEEEVLEEHIRNCVGVNPFYWERHNEPFNNFSVDKMARALYIGYEVELTPEDIVKNMLTECSMNEEKLGNHPQHNWWVGRRSGIVDTLNTLNIKIEGVNA